MRTLQRSLLLFALTLLVLIPRNIFSCGPFFDEAVFSFEGHPDVPVTQYLAGKLGVLRPGYYRLFLVAAYRSLSNKPFTPAERAALEPLLTHEAESAEEMDGYGFEDIDRPSGPRPRSPSQVWLTERAKALGEAPPQNPEFDQNLDWGNYQSFMNCPDAAFTTAVQTMHDRQQKWGANSADLKAWIAGQDIVFSRCSKRQEAMPPAVATNNKLLQQDRDYQIAAALFYSGVPDQLVQAQQRFDAIGQDKTSPWHTWGPYLAARSLIRAATLKSTEDKKFDQALMTDAEARLKKINATPDLASTHHASEQMLGFIEARLHPTERAHELARKLANGTSTDVKQDFIDYRYLLDNSSAEPNAEARKDDLTDWIRTFQAGDKEHAIAKWRETKSLPWFVAAINAVDAKDPAAKDLLAAAAKTDARDPRLLTVLYRRVVLLRAMNSDKDARSLIDANLAYLGNDAPISSRNLLWGSRMAMAATFDEFLRFAPREDASGHHLQAHVLKAGDPWPPNTPNDVYFDTDATAVLNRALPGTMLMQAATSTLTPHALQVEITQSEWVRALLLNQTAIAAKLSPAMKQATPVLGPSIDAYEKAATDDDRHRTVLFTVLHNPGMRPYVTPNVQRSTEISKIDNFHDNWWCEDVGASTEVKPSEYSEAGAPKPHPAPNPAWLNSTDKAAGAAEWNTLSKLGAAPTYLGREVIAWAKASPDDPRIPEALHLVVRATRYGCGDDRTSSYSQQAFKLLHAKYPKSEWTKKTPYFY